MTFENFEFHPAVAAGIAAANFTSPTPIQKDAIPPVLEGRDVMGLAQTGTGKTAAFALPILNRLMGKNRGYVRALIVAPTRELAEQIHQDFVVLGQKTGLKSTAIYGGVGINPQKQILKRGVEIVVACPGRLLDHLRQKTISLSKLEVLVLDEADHMFDMGFLPDIRQIIRQTPKDRQTLLFSATMPSQIRHLANDVLKNPTTVQVGVSAPAETVRHALYPVTQNLKTKLLLALLRHTDTGSVLVFTRTKHRAKRLGLQLSKAGYRSTSLQGNLSQGKRQAALNGFRDGTYQILVATDIAARGIDVSEISHVINYDIPSTPEAYIHRIGRTGRATHTGDAFTLITAQDLVMAHAIDRILGSKVERRKLPDFDYDQHAAVDVRPPRKFLKPAKPWKSSKPSARRPSRPKLTGRKKGLNAPHRPASAMGSSLAAMPSRRAG
jgi:ATP-dependent RNA helicase RhlE